MRMFQYLERIWYEFYKLIVKAAFFATWSSKEFLFVFCTDKFYTVADFDQAKRGSVLILNNLVFWSECQSLSNLADTERRYTL